MNDPEFKNFHRLLCDRFGYVHDEQFWWRDQLSLIEHIAKDHPDTRGADAVTDAMVSAAIETFGMKPSWGAMKRALDAAIKAGGV